MASPSWIGVFCLVSLTTPAFASTEIYRYTDDSGTLNFTTELYEIPQKYRDQAVPLKLGGSPPVSPPPLQPILRVVRSSGEYRMSDHDTRMDATRLAIDYAKRQALEEVAMYLESTTEVKTLDVTRDEIRTYTAGIVTVLDQQISTRLEDGEIVIHVDLTAQADEHEVIEAIALLRENELAKQELISLRITTDQLRQQLETANQALATANTPERVQALTTQRQHLLNRLQAETETTVPSSLARLRRFLSGPIR
jgi:antitoxin component HigA of HigAB toxin-antitoxin module